MKNSRNFTIGNTTIQIVFWIIIALAINILSSYLFFRADITEDNLYTLSDGTKQIAKDLKETTKIIFYFSKDAKNIPLVYKSYGNRVAELLAEYVNQNPQNLSLDIANPKPDTETEEWAKRYNIKGVGDANSPFYMGIVVLQSDRTSSIPFLDPNQEKLLEYSLSQALVQVSQTEKKTVGLLSPLPIMGAPASPMQRQGGSQPWALHEELNKRFNVVSVPTNSLSIPEDITMLFVVHPSSFSDTLLYAIDQFVLRGGKLMLFVDPSVRILTGSNPYQRKPQASQFAKLLTHWGINFDNTTVVGEESRATQVGIGGGRTISYSLWQTLDKTAFNTKLPALESMKNVILPEAGFFTVNESSPLQKITPLISVTKQAKGISSFAVVSQDPFKNEKNLQPLDDLNKVVQGKDKEEKTKKTIPVKRYVSAILQGDLTSAFDARPIVTKKKDQTFIGKQTELQKSVKPAEIFMITDVDFISDTYSVRWLNLGGQRLMMPQNNNLAFVMNITEFMNGLQSLANIRTRGVTKRPFLRFEQLQQQAQATYQAEVERVQGKLRRLNSQLSNLETKTDKAVLTQEQLDQVNSFKQEMQNTRTKLREIRKLLRQDIEKEQNWLIALNLFIVPIFLLFIGFIIYKKRFTIPMTGEKNVS